VGVLIVLVGFGILTRRDDHSPSTDPNPSLGATSHAVTYTVSGLSRTADITYSDANGDTSQHFDVMLPWTKTFTAEEGAVLSISARRGGAPGEITCDIRIDGRQLQTNTSSGPNAICSASAKL
jgi:MmpS family membrane protein